MQHTSVKIEQASLLTKYDFLYLFSMAPLDLFISKTSCVYRGEAITPIYSWRPLFLPNKIG